MADRVKPAFQVENYQKENFLKLHLFRTFKTMFNDTRVFKMLPNNQGMFAESKPIVIPNFPTAEMIAGKQLKLAVLIQKDTQPWDAIGLNGSGNISFRVTLMLYADKDYPQFFNGKYSFRNYMNTQFLNQFNVVAYVSLKINDKINQIICTDLWNRTKMNTAPKLAEYQRQQDATRKEEHDADLFGAEYILTQGIGLEMLCLATTFVLDIQISILRRYQHWVNFINALEIQVVDQPSEAAYLYLLLSKKHPFQIVDTDLMTREANKISEENPQQVLDVLINFYRNRQGRSEYEHEIMKALAIINMNNQTGRYTKPTLTRDVMQFVPLLIKDINEDKIREYFEELDFTHVRQTSSVIMMSANAKNFIYTCNEYVGNQPTEGTDDAMMVIDNNHTEGLMSYFKPKEIGFLDAIYPVLHNDNTVIFKFTDPSEVFQISYFIGKMSPVMYAWIAAKARMSRMGFTWTSKDTPYDPVEKGKGNSTHVSTDILARLLTYDNTVIQYITPLGVYRIDIMIYPPEGLKKFSDIKYSKTLSEEQKLISLIEAAYKQHGYRARQLPNYPSDV
jgi:hypothetical protein